MLIIIEVRCDNAFWKEDVWKDCFDQTVHDELSADLNTVIGTYRLRCIKKDGREIIERVGNVADYAQMLELLYSCRKKSEEELEMIEDIREIVKEMGWSERRTL